MNSYNYCKLCTIKVPRVFSDIHVTQCHHSKKLSCSRLHPLVKDGELVASVNIIKDSNSNVEIARNDGKLYVDEPEFMKHFNYDFTEKFAFFNELDLYHSHIMSFSHVCLQVDSWQSVFIAVSNTCDKQQIGTICLYEKGIKNFPISKTSSYITVKRIDRVVEAKKVKLSTPSLVSESFLHYHFKKKFHADFELGCPDLFRRKGDSVTLKTLGESSCVVEVEIEDNDFNLSTCSINLNTPLSITMESFKSLSFIENETPEGMDVSLEGDPLKELKGNFKSSTPNRKARRLSSSKSGSGSKLKKSGSRSHASSSLCCTDTILPTYFWLSKNTEIEVVISGGKFSLVDDIKTPKFQSEKSTFFKTKEFYYLKDLISRKLEADPENELLQHISWSGLLLIGLPGSGKRALVESISNAFNMPLITVSELDFTRLSRSGNYILNCFEKAKTCAPSILFFNPFECFAQRNQTKFSDKILKIAKMSKSLTKPVILIGATSSPELVSPHVRHAGRFSKDVYLSLPDVEGRIEILQQLLDNQACDIVKDDVISLGRRSLGFSPADVDASVKMAWNYAIQKYESKNKIANKSQMSLDEEHPHLYLGKEHLETAIKSVVPSCLKDEYIAVPKVQWQDIWGYEHIKSKLKRIAVVMATEHCSKGILFYGPPGCSKTMMARALATETQFSFFSIKCSNLLSKYVGETEKTLSVLLERATLSSPSLVFIDEIDSLCGRQDGGGTESCVLPELLSLMRKSYSSGNILFVGATNRPHVLDEALLSAGYFELLFHVDLPDCGSRCAIWNGLLDDVPQHNVDSANLCSRTEGYSCAEIKNIYNEAGYSLVEMELMANQNIELEEHILKTLALIPPRTSKSVLERIRTFRSTRGQ